MLTTLTFCMLVGSISSGTIDSNGNHPLSNDGNYFIERDDYGDGLYRAYPSHNHPAVWIRLVIVAVITLIYFIVMMAKGNPFQAFGKSLFIFIVLFLALVVTCQMGIT